MGARGDHCPPSLEGGGRRVRSPCQRSFGKFGWAAPTQQRWRGAILGATSRIARIVIVYVALVSGRLTTVSSGASEALVASGS